MLAIHGTPLHLSQGQAKPSALILVKNWMREVEERLGR